MKIKKPRFVSATTKKDSRETTLAKSLSNVKWGKSLHCKYFVENKESLSTLYNMSLIQALKDDIDCLILVHDDVILEEDPIPKLEKLFDDYDLVGVAGASKIELKTPALWHLMSGGFHGGHLHGCVQHLDPMGGKPKSNFGPYPNRVVMIDGVFMVLSRKLLESGVRFDENIPSKFHFYDIDFSLSVAQTENLKVGVGDILITHESPGLREFTDDWREGEKYFMFKYS
jgi:hypothetical protein